MGRPSLRSIFDVNSTQGPDSKVAGFRSPDQSPAAPHLAAASSTQTGTRIGLRVKNLTQHRHHHARRRRRYRRPLRRNPRHQVATNSTDRESNERENEERKTENGPCEPPWKICAPSNSLFRSPAHRILRPMGSSLFGITILAFFDKNAQWHSMILAAQPL
jgi:hypothetical protein